MYAFRYEFLLDATGPHRQSDDAYSTFIKGTAPVSERAVIGHWLQHVTIARWKLVLHYAAVVAVNDKQHIVQNAFVFQCVDNRPDCRVERADHRVVGASINFLDVLVFLKVLARGLQRYRRYGKGNIHKQRPSRVVVRYKGRRVARNQRGGVATFPDRFFATSPVTFADPIGFMEVIYSVIEAAVEIIETALRRKHVARCVSELPLPEGGGAIAD